MLSRFVYAALVLIAVSAIVGCSEGTDTKSQADSTAVLSSTSDGMARGPFSPEEMASALGLSSDQRDQMKAIHEKYRAKRQELHATFTQSESREDKFAAMKSLRDAMEADVKAVLTADQFAKLQTLRKEQFSAVKNRFGGTPEERLDRRVTFLTKQLSLSDEQQTKIRTVLADVISQEPTLGSSVPTGKDWAARRKQTMDAIRPILTADQIQKLEQMKSNPRSWRKGQPEGVSS